MLNIYLILPETIIESITNALPIKFLRKSPPKKDSPMKIETLQTFAPELLRNDTINIKPPQINIIEDEPMEESESISTNKSLFKIPKMPLLNIEVIKLAVEKRKRKIMQDASVNTATDHDFASELAKYVGTLKKISLIAEEFNQKTGTAYYTTPLSCNIDNINNHIHFDYSKEFERNR